MRPVKQTKRGGSGSPPQERGDCLPACLASILEVSIETVGNDHHAAGDRWFDVIADRCVALGHEIAFLDTRWPPATWWIAFVPSLNLTSRTLHGACAGIGCPLCEFEGDRVDGHAIVMSGYFVAHDPSIGARTYEFGTELDLSLVREGWALLPCPPSVRG